MEEARQPMGMHKKVHIQKITEIEAVRKRWHNKFGRFPNEEDVERMFKNFVPLQVCFLTFKKKKLYKYKNSFVRYLNVISASLPW